MKKELIFAFIFGSVSAAYANDNLDEAEEEPVPQTEVRTQDPDGLWNFKEFLLDENGKWSLGVGTVVQNSPFRGEKISVTPIPVIDYSSKNLFFRGLRAGYHIKKVQNPREGGFFTDVFLSPRFRPGQSRKNLSLDFGIAAGYQAPYGAITFTMQPEITGGSGGTELAAEYAFTFVTSNRKQLFIPALKMTWQSRELANYLWGIDEATYLKTLANPDETVLEPYRLNRSVLNFSAAMTHVYKIDEHWNTMALAKITALDDDIIENPAIERQFDYSFIFGFAYTF